MAPRHYLGAVVKLYNTRLSSRAVSPRAAPSDSLIATIIIVSIASSLLLATTVYVMSRFWKKIIAQSSTFQQPEKSQDEVAAPARRPSKWARQNSNVLWSMYIEEDDLKAQFAASPKSRLFSIGSVSTVDGRCPLDRSQSHASPLSQQEPVEANPIKTSEPVLDMRSRTPYEHQTTPTKNLSRVRSMSQPYRHKHASSFEEMAMRKQSLPVPRIEVSIAEGRFP